MWKKFCICKNFRKGFFLNCPNSHLLFFFRQKQLKEDCAPGGKNVTFCQNCPSGVFAETRHQFFQIKIVITRFYTTRRTSCKKIRSCTGCFSEVLSEISQFVLLLVKNSYKRLFTWQRKTLHFVKKIARLQGVCTEILCFRYATKSLCKKHEKRYILSKFSLWHRRLFMKFCLKSPPFLLLEKNN